MATSQSRKTIRVTEAVGDELAQVDEDAPEELGSVGVLLALEEEGDPGHAVHLDQQQSEDPQLEGGGEDAGQGQGVVAPAGIEAVDVVLAQPGEDQPPGHLDEDVPEPGRHQGKSEAEQLPEGSRVEGGAEVGQDDRQGENQGGGAGDRVGEEHPFHSPPQMEDEEEVGADIDDDVGQADAGNSAWPSG